jgi:hypothetical protein
MVAMASLFERLEQPQSVETTELSQAQKLRATSSNVESRLLNWLINQWPEPVISARDLVTYTRSVRTCEEAVALATNLEKRGWLIRLPTHRYDRRVWAIVRDPAQLGAPPHADSSNQSAVA